MAARYGNWWTRRAPPRAAHEPRYVADDLLTLKLAVLKGTGIGMLPDYMCSDELRAGHLVPALPGWAPRPGIFHAVFPSRRGLVPAVRRFLDFMGETIAREGLTTIAI